MEIEEFKKAIKIHPIIHGINYGGIFNQFPIIESERLILRDVRKEDIPKIYKFVQDEDILKYYKSPDENYDDINYIERAFYEAAKVSFERIGRVSWAIVKKDDNQIIGIRDSFTDDLINSPVELESFIVKEFRLKGYGSEAIKAVIEFYSRHGVRTFIAKSSRENIASVKILEKNGFKEIQYNPFLRLSIFGLQL